jgi:hypothetical protein
MDRVQWTRRVNDELNKLAPDKQAVRGWVESQDFRVIDSQEKPEGSGGLRLKTQR